MKNTLVLVLLWGLASGLYFRLQQGQPACFKDEVIRNTTIQFKATLLESEELDAFIAASNAKEGFTVGVKYTDGTTDPEVVYPSAQVVTLREHEGAAGF
mmetsp:Transcript_13305/g.9607  ORF Transcript_13305/g.9607 Transcript_13305/m.9607 type:complete len:99 (+) Transcript_13305:12-308(+)